MNIVINAANRIANNTSVTTAASKIYATKADPEVAKAWLESVGFQGLELATQGEDLIRFVYKKYDKAVLKKNFGEPKVNPSSGSIRYRVEDNGKVKGVIAVWEQGRVGKSTIVSLVNSKRGVERGLD